MSLKNPLHGWESPKNRRLSPNAAPGRGNRGGKPSAASGRTADGESPLNFIRAGEKSGLEVFREAFLYNSHTTVAYARKPRAPLLMKNGTV